MRNRFKLYNTYTHSLATFVPINPPNVGLYVCGPTVYGPPHLGHARSAITFDLLVRYLRNTGYQVRYIRNITDVGHLMHDADEGEDKIARQAKFAAVSPMEIAQTYSNRYHVDMGLLNTLSPSIEPLATGHIPEQIKLTQTLLDKGWGYMVNGSVYFDLMRYQARYPYGVLSGKKIDDLHAGTRSLTKTTDKRHSFDFALWKKADPRHIMRWTSPWGAGFPGWHAECTAMSERYLGIPFDIHGGGLDLCFPHHECELAQATIAFGCAPARFWMHNNLVMIDGQKMSKSAQNAVTLQACFTGHHPLLTKPYSPMVLRFFMLQAHYRSTINFSEEALQGAVKGYYKLINGLMVLNKLPSSTSTTAAASSEAENSMLTEMIFKHCRGCYDAMDEDMNTAKVIAHLFALCKVINRIYSNELSLSSCSVDSWALLKKTYVTFLQDILGLKETHRMQPHVLLATLLDCYKEAKATQNDARLLAIRKALKVQGVSVQDSNIGIDWRYIV